MQIIYATFCNLLRRFLKGHVDFILFSSNGMILDVIPFKDDHTLVNARLNNRL